MTAVIESLERHSIRRSVLKEEQEMSETISRMCEYELFTSKVHKRYNAYMDAVSDFKEHYHELTDKKLRNVYIKIQKKSVKLYRAIIKSYNSVLR